MRKQRDTERHRETQRDRETGRQRHRETERERERYCRSAVQAVLFDYIQGA